MKAAQVHDIYLKKIWDSVENRSQSCIQIHKDDSFKFGNRICVSNDQELKKEVMKEGSKRTCGGTI